MPAGLEPPPWSHRLPTRGDSGTVLLGRPMADRSSIEFWAGIA
jgi:hypothetical protein